MLSDSITTVRIRSNVMRWAIQRIFGLKRKQRLKLLAKENNGIFVVTRNDDGSQATIWYSAMFAHYGCFFAKIPLLTFVVCHVQWCITVDIMLRILNNISIWPSSISCRCHLLCSISQRQERELGKMTSGILQQTHTRHSQESRIKWI